MNHSKEVQVRSRVENRPNETEQTGQHRSRIVLAVVVPFLNEREHLPTLLGSIERQTRPPDRLVLVDDGSTDGSYEVALAFAATHPYTVALRRPARPPVVDRLATASELRAFQWGLEAVDVPYDLVAKLDADLELSPSHFAEIAAQFESDPRLGLAGAYLSIRLPNGSTVQERHPPDHIRGPNKFYRRACLEQIGPLSAHLGWDGIDQVKARMHGWRTRSLTLTGGATIHLRPTGTHDGRLRAYRRWGECAYGCGSHPLNVLAGGLLRTRERPYVVAGCAYVLGWVLARLRGRPRADAEVMAFKRREDLHRLRSLGRPTRSTSVL